MTKINNFYDAWTFLENHRIFAHSHLHRLSWFPYLLDIEVVKVNPTNLTIEDDESLNTKVQVWLECGVYMPSEKSEYECLNNYDPQLNSGGDTFEDAIIELAQNVLKYYGDGKYTEKEDAEYEEFYKNMKFDFFEQMPIVNGDESEKLLDNDEEN